MRPVVSFALLVLAAATAHGAAPQFLAVSPALSRDHWLERRQPGQEPSPSDVPVYERFELRIDLSATFENPYDPEQIDLSAEFTSPSGKTMKIWGFYNPTSWAAQWMVRFAPTEEGRWTYVLKVRDVEGTAESAAGEFTATPSRSHGFVRIADNKRYFQYSDGSSFYGVGMWYNDAYDQFGRGAITEQGLDELKARGCNFISFFPTPLETRGTGLGRYDENLCGRLDQVFDWCDERDLHISWNLVFHSYVSEAVWGGGNARYRNNPYRTIAPARDWFGSEEVWKYQERLYRYIIARWGYSRSLFLWFIVDEINGTEGWQEGGVDRAEAWCRRMNDFFHEHDPYARPTTGTQSGGILEWWPNGYRIFDVAAREIYEAQGHPMPRGGKPDLMNDHPLRASYLNYAKQTAALWNGFEKPAIIGECGWDHTYYEPAMPGYAAMYHNALWASLANGASATPLWWAYSPYVNDAVLTGQLRALARFVRDIDFANRQWTPVDVKMSTGDGWAMKSDDLVFGWVANPMSGVAKETFTLSGLDDGHYELRLYRTWPGIYMEPLAIAAARGTLSVAIPELTSQSGHAQHMGDDVAFKLTRRAPP
ncbi:MAG: hypothetical protein DCC67_15160 [Planctomycetota bacterium]|nr:MAG: hypothetical protein DCC67_15160 [Planctomycetota bacterium]